MVRELHVSVVVLQALEEVSHSLNSFAGWFYSTMLYMCACKHRNLLFDIAFLLSTKESRECHEGIYIQETNKS